MRRILRPLFAVGVILTIALYANAQFTAPKAKNTLKSITRERRLYRKTKAEQPFVQHLLLKDESKIIFQNMMRRTSVF